MIPAVLTFVEGLLGPKFAKFAKPLIYVVAILLMVALFAVGKCSYDRHVIANNETKTQQRAKPATDQAANERATDTIANAKTEERMHNVIAAQPDQPIAPTSRALSCERLRKLGRNPAACR